MADESRTTRPGEEQPPGEKYQADLVLVIPRPPEEQGKDVQIFFRREIDDIFDEILVLRDKNTVIEN